MAVPTLNVTAATDITTTSVTGNGEILTGTGVTRRGFQYNTVQAEDKQIYEDGTFSTGTYTLTLSGLTPGQTYWYRAFAENSDGTGYSGWIQFTVTASTYNVTINSVDRTSDIVASSLRISDVINDQVNSCSFLLDDLSSTGIPNNDEEIVITLDDGTKLFAGYVVNVDYRNDVNGGGQVIAAVECVDYTRLLDRNLVHKTYQDMTDKAIIKAIVSTYCPGFGITTTNVVEGATISQISFNYIQPSQALRRICEITGRHWFIDYDKDIHYIPGDQDATPFDIDSNPADYSNLSLKKSADQIKNRVYVRGGTKLSDFTTYSELGDGEKIKFIIPDKPHDVTVEVNRNGAGYVEESVGIKNVDTTGYKWYLNFQEKYIEQDTGEVVLTTNDIVRVTYKYDIPILVAVEDTASIHANGQREFAIFDKSIPTTQAARDRASGELIDYANDLVDGQFTTYTDGFRSGQYININRAEYDVNDNYVVQRVNAVPIGAGVFVYTIQVASAKTLGIIKFLIQLLEANKNLIELDDNEVVDELLQLTDSILADSLIDSLVIDSTGPYHIYQDDSLSLNGNYVARWGLSEYKY